MTHARKRAYERGFTLTELIMTMTLAAILGVIALPAFNGLIAQQRARTSASALYATLAKARSQALTLNSNVSVVTKDGIWHHGWQIKDASNNVLDDYPATTAATILNSGAGPVVFRPSGRLPPGAAPVFTIQTVAGSANIFQCVSLDPSGRPYMKAAQTC